MPTHTEAPTAGADIGQRQIGLEGRIVVDPFKLGQYSKLIKGDRVIVGSRVEQPSADQAKGSKNEYRLRVGHYRSRSKKNLVSIFEADQIRDAAVELVLMPARVTKHADILPTFRAWAQKTALPLLLRSPNIHPC